MHSRYDFEKSYLPQKDILYIYIYIYIMCLRSISRSLELRKNIESNLKKPSSILFLQKDLRCPELGEKGALLTIHLYLLF